MILIVIVNITKPSKASKEKKCLKNLGFESLIPKLKINATYSDIIYYFISVFSGGFHNVHFMVINSMWQLSRLYNQKNISSLNIFVSRLTQVTNMKDCTIEIYRRWQL